MRKRAVSSPEAFQKPPLVQKCSKTATHLKRCNGPNGCRARKCIKNRHSSRNSIVLDGRYVRGRGKPAARSEPAPLQAATTAIVNKRAPLADAPRRPGPILYRVTRLLSKNCAEEPPALGLFLSIRTLACRSGLLPGALATSTDDLVQERRLDVLDLDRRCVHGAFARKA